MAFHLRHGQGQGVGAPVFRAGGPHNVLEVVGKRDLLGEIPLFQQGGLDLLRLQRILPQDGRRRGNWRDGHGIRQDRFRFVSTYGRAGHSDGPHHGQDQGGHAGQGGDPAAPDDTPAALIPAAAGLPALRLRLLLCPHSLLFLLLPGGGPRPSSGRLRHLILPAVPDLHGADPAFQVVHVCRHTLVLLHGPAVLFCFSLAHFLDPPVKNTRLTS